MLLYSNTYPYFLRPKAEEEQITIVQSFVRPDRGPNQRFTELEATMLTITLLMRFQLIWKGIIFRFILNLST